MKRILLAATVAFAIIISCEKKQEEHADHITATENTTDEHHDQNTVAQNDDHDEHAKLELNNGEKWTMNAEMKPHLAQMETQLNAYDPAKSDYKILAENLSATNDELIKSCTIKGKPHDVLHAWLYPHMQQIDKLKKADDREEANEIVAELQKSMQTYHEYFN